MDLPDRPNFPAVLGTQSTEIDAARPGPILPPVAGGAAAGAAARRVLAGLARRGVDLRPALRSLRDQIAPSQPPLLTLRPAPEPPPPPPAAPRAAAAPAILPPAPAATAPPPALVDWLAARTRTLERLLLAAWPDDLPTHGTLVSVIMPARDRAGLIGRAIESVLAQSYQDWELLIIDDGSTDSTAAAVTPYLADPRITYRGQPPAGAAAARNAGLAAAQGALCAYLDTDNAWEPDYLRRIVSVFTDAAVQSAYGALILADAAPQERRILWDEFDRARLGQGNFIDMNVFVHRHAAYRLHGGFDTELKRLSDWDLILRYTEAAPALAVPVLGARYHTTAPGRLTDTEKYHPAYRRIRGKSRIATRPARPVRVLYLLWHYPQGSEMYIEAEIQGLRRLGAEIEVWSEVVATTPYPSDIPVHHGTLEAAIAAARPDVIHSHWLNIAERFLDVIQAHNLRITVRGHGFDINAPDIIRRVADHPATAMVYLYPHQLALLAAPQPRIKPIGNAFETTLFRPAPAKDPRLVFRAAAALPAKDLPMFLHLAKQFPTHRFVLAIAACNLMESYVGELLALRREMESPAEILVNAPHAEVARLMGLAGIYLHTVVAPAGGGTPIGQPVSIAEAMGSGCYILVRDLAPLADYAADAGDTYADETAAAALITATMSWDAAEWSRRWRRAEERGWTHFSGDDAFWMIHEDWLSLAT